MKNKWSKMHGLDKYIIFCFTTLIIYSIVHIIIFMTTGQEMSIISRLLFALFGGEVLVCALIKKFKLDRQYKEKKKKEIKEGMDDDVVG